MSEKKRKPQVIHVDRVIIKANEVIIQEERDEHRKGKEERRENRRDPWGFFGSNESADQDRKRDVREDEDEDEDEKRDRYWF
ncbi:hypothetical protein [Guptibacillus sedimenti]|uniref:hypothetical protein n=1 Tax=Guptibacillus sedimenti TaxID=3025680 RepID=UPI00235ED68F|nr:hypothetical protein [Pseudalkalibacillus sedimenti]